MQITIHRGIDQIGGCITEIATSEARILIDLGQNLPDSNGEVKDPLATKEAIEKLAEGADAIFYTHYHGDHVGLMEYVPTDIEQYIGEVAKEVLIVKATYIPNQNPDRLQSLKTFTPAQRIAIKDITITSFFVSHSAADAYMFLIEAEGKKVLHTGDFRSHGYLGKGLHKFVPHYIGQVDVLITEGTMLSRSTESVKSENDLQQELKTVMARYKYLFVVGSSTDMDRLATLYKANPKGRLFVCDRYQRDILELFTKSSGNHSDLYNFDNLSVFPKDGLLDEMRAKGFCMMVRPNGYDGKYSRFTEMTINSLPQSKTVAIYSMWSGYLDRASTRNHHHVNFLSKFANIERVHTSGHATTECLAELCTMTNPRLAIIPIHSEKSSEYANLPISDELKNKIILKDKLMI
ncbi:MAG: MBL fold metallo-hydrolase [Rikenellaceae bacterium]